MPILAEYKEGKFIPLKKVKLNEGDLVELDLLPKQFSWKGALKSIKMVTIKVSPKNTIFIN